MEKSWFDIKSENKELWKTNMKYKLILSPYDKNKLNQMDNTISQLVKNKTLLNDNTYLDKYDSIVKNIILSNLQFYINNNGVKRRVGSSIFIQKYNVKDILYDTRFEINEIELTINDLTLIVNNTK